MNLDKTVRWTGIISCCAAVLALALDIARGIQSPIETISRTFEDSHRNGRCQQRASNINWRVDATDGWTINAESITPTVTGRSVNSAFEGIHNVSPQGFNVTGTVSNNGSCVRLFGSTIAYDARGSLAVKVDYDEARPKPLDVTDAE